MLTIDHSSGFPIVYHDATENERLRHSANGYRPFERELERNPFVYRYARGDMPPNYPVPAIPDYYTDFYSVYRVTRYKNLMRYI